MVKRLLLRSRSRQWRNKIVSAVKRLVLKDKSGSRTTRDDYQIRCQEPGPYGSLEDFPVEVLELILSCMHPWEISSLSMTCKSLQLLTVPSLYRNIRIRCCASVIRSPSLVRTLLEKPALRSYVESVQMFRIDYCRLYGCFRLHNIPNDPFNLYHVEKHLRSSGIGPIDTWLSALRYKCPAATIAILLSLTPNLVNLDLDEEPFVQPFFLDRVLFRLQDPLRNDLVNDDIRASYSRASSPSPFPYLRSVSIAQSLKASLKRNKYGSSIPIVFHFLRLPSLRRIGGSMPGASLSHFMSNPQGLSPYSITELSCVMAPPAVLEKLLNFIPNLQHLEYDFWCRDPDLGSLANSLSGALYPARSTLRSLKFKTNFITKSRVLVNECKLSKVVGSPCAFFHEFDLLTSLELPWILLCAQTAQLNRLCEILSCSTGDCGHREVGLQDILPRGLQILTINDHLAPKVDLHTACKRRNVLIRGYLKKWKTHTPYLQRIRVRGTWNFWNPEYVEDMKKMCVDAKMPYVFLE